MKKAFVLLASVMFVGGAFAQSHTAEAYPQTNSKAQRAAEVHKSTKPTGVIDINDGSTGRGAGSGETTPTPAEVTAQKKRDAREAQPHVDPVQGKTPK